MIAATYHFGPTQLKRVYLPTFAGMRDNHPDVEQVFVASNLQGPLFIGDEPCASNYSFSSEPLMRTRPLWEETRKDKYALVGCTFW